MKFLKLFILIAAILLIPVTIFASISEIKAPEHSKLNRFKDDFECDRGYIKNKTNWSCNEIKLPENAVLTLAGNDWRCVPNYKREGDKCIKVELPENAKFFIQGSGWYCHSGYHKLENKCVKFDVPANAHVNYSGNYWECNKGFKESENGKSCIEVKIPSNATSNYIGTFNCSSGYKKEGDECKRDLDVENGRFYTTGSDFYCLNGYRKNEADRKCEKIIVPENAHEDSASLEGWSCNREYIKEGSECKKFTLSEKAFWSGNIWKCEQGYRKNFDAKTCEKISLPENSHSADTYDGWLCNDGFVKNYRENRCDKS